MRQTARLAWLHGVLRLAPALDGMRDIRPEPLQHVTDGVQTVFDGEPARCEIASRTVDDSEQFDMRLLVLRRSYEQ